MLQTFRRCWWLGCACVLFGSSRTWSQEPAPSLAEESMAGIVRRLVSDRRALERSYDTPLSAKRRQRMQQFWRAALDRCGELDFATLSLDDQIDFLLLTNYIRHELRTLDYQARKEAESAVAYPFAQDIVDLAEARREMRPIDGKQAAETLIRVTAAAKAVYDDVASGKLHMAPTSAERAAGIINRLRRTLSEWFKFYDGYDPEFSWWNRNPFAKAEPQLRQLAELLRSRAQGPGPRPQEETSIVSEGHNSLEPGVLSLNSNQAPGHKLTGRSSEDSDKIIGDPIGADALLSELEFEVIPYSPTELIELAETEFEWCQRERRQAAQEMGLGDDWRQALQRVKDLHEPPGKQPQLIRSLAEEAVAFLDQHELVTIPPLCREVWRMEMMAPERQKMSPYFLGGEVIIVSYPTDSMEHADKLMSMRGNNRHFARATVHHELIPGHHLQGFMAQRYRTHRDVFSTPFFVEGWALHWELLLWDLGFGKTPEDRTGMLFWRAHRCARIIFSLKFHLGQLTPEQCVDYLVENVGHERNNAEAEVRRSVSGDYGPLYQAAYMLGGLQLRGLHQELVGGGKMSQRAFHDAVLRENEIPIEFIRAKLLREELSPDFTSRWRFYQGPAR